MKRHSTLLTPEFEKEIVKSEYQRTRLIIGLFLMSMVAATVNYFFIDENVISIFGGAHNYFFVIGWLLALIAYEGIILLVISYLQRRYQRVSDGFRFAHTLIEVTFPSLLMLYMVEFRDQLFFIDSPVVFIYSLFITLSVLHLDFKLSFITGLLAAIEYAFIIFYGFNLADTDPRFATFLPQNTFYLRCIILIIGGIAGGFVAEELNY